MSLGLGVQGLEVGGSGFSVGFRVLELPFKVHPGIQDNQEAH